MPIGMEKFKGGYNMQHITTFYARTESFVIVKNPEGYYLAINTKYIDNNGKLTRPLNGLQMNASKDLEQCITSTRVQVNADYYMSCGMDILTALQKAAMEK